MTTRTVFGNAVTIPQGSAQAFTLEIVSEGNVREGYGIQTYTAVIGFHVGSMLVTKKIRLATDVNSGGNGTPYRAKLFRAIYDGKLTEQVKEQLTLNLFDDLAMGTVREEGFIRRLGSLLHSSVDP